MKLIGTKKIILASKSPRRKDLLEQLGLNIKIAPSNTDEKSISMKNPEKYVKELSLLKANNTALFYPDDWVIGADTIVVGDGQILGKPRSKTQAIAMLNKLNDCEHSVYTGFSIVNQKKTSIITKSVETKVSFKYLSPREIQWYVNTGEPFDKAGSYAIQGIGAFLVKRISGSYSNVVGLPVCEVIEELMNLNIIQI
ncbi:MAG: septum formation inhibitor Maf [Desulfobacula sp.]|jgi:septum formation protein|uniref:Maf family protein n=1 Tax=Desulfobacula sp. TaxID=2593537 RepID=UPI001D5E5679|nr:septum formation inhibitor Maf [Desulfobacula sp.]MBT3484400.1 septum formation inhibitor Maf [Desulfobacula sp.]MBT3803315.1 septum formation inhibitor Maf [Desulfobacula sp.]MBT4023719.1 septum formation inhibitor Maf [Desulfobacula sp.]MBT4197961.1 septum formation inhibitor Maf [Desulfobacula sp.]